MRYVRAYAYDTSNPGYKNRRASNIQATDEWYYLVVLLYKLEICEVAY